MSDQDPTSAQLIAEAQAIRDRTFWIQGTCSCVNAVAYHYTGERMCFFLAIFCFVLAYLNSD